MDWFSLGYWGLFLLSFLAASVVPISSEGMLTAMLYAGYNAQWVLIIASLGNILGGISSYLLGYWGHWGIIEKILRTPPEKVKKYEGLVSKYGVWLALFTWLPFVGDLLALGLGLYQSPILKTFLLMSIGKIARYVAVIYLFDYFSN
jgi:membrane protein YqaA with SNARE-associated domain